MQKHFGDINKRDESSILMIHNERYEPLCHCLCQRLPVLLWRSFAAIFVDTLTCFSSVRQHWFLSNRIPNIYICMYIKDQQERLDSFIVYIVIETRKINVLLILI